MIEETQGAHKEDHNIQRYGLLTIQVFLVYTARI
jgi:hypothetical protein